MKNFWNLIQIKIFEIFFRLQIPSLEEQEKIIKEMEYYDKLKEIHQTHITILISILKPILIPNQRTF